MKMEQSQVWKGAMQALCFDGVLMVFVIHCDDSVTLAGHPCGILRCKWGGVTKRGGTDHPVLVLQVWAVDSYQFLFCHDLEPLFWQNVTLTWLLETGCHLKCLQEIPLPLLVRMTPDYKKKDQLLKNKKTAALLLFLCFQDYGSSWFPDEMNWPRALHNHTSRCNNSSCTRNHSLPTICFCASATVL